MRDNIVKSRRVELALRTFAIAMRNKLQDMCVALYSSLQNRVLNDIILFNLHAGAGVYGLSKCRGKGVSAYQALSGGTQRRRVILVWKLSCRVILGSLDGLVSSSCTRARL